MNSEDTMEEALRRLGNFHKQFMKDFSWIENMNMEKPKWGVFHNNNESNDDYFVSWDIVRHEYDSLFGRFNIWLNKLLDTSFIWDSWLCFHTVKRNFCFAKQKNDRPSNK